MSQTVGDSLAAAREAFLKHDWIAALDLYKKADDGDALHPEDLESMGDAAWWAARPDEAIGVLQRAYAAYLGAGNRARAGYVALSLAREFGVKFDGSVSAGWLNRAQKLLEAEPEVAETGYLYARRAVQAINAGNNDEAIAAARLAIEVGARVGDPNLLAIGSVYQGTALVEKGDVTEGLRLMEDAALAAVSGELGLFATGTVYCNTIAACCDMADFTRARDWADAARRWSESHPSQPLIPGDCRVHEAQVLALRGAWAEAEESARRGAEELRAFNRLYHAGEALYQVGAIRLHLGDTVAAHDLFQQASELGRDPQPGLSELLLGEGKLDGALAAIRRALDEESSRLSRARLLPVFVEISLASRDVDSARTAAEELEAIATSYPAPTLRAAADSAMGAVLLAQGDARESARTLRRAVSSWQEVDAPYEGAQARALLGESIALLGDAEGAVLELQGARAAFERLGATPKVKRIDARLRDHQSDGHLTDAGRGQKTFLFTDMVNSTSLLEAIGDEAWLDLQRWHDLTLRALLAEHGGQEVDHAGDGFFVAFDDPIGAISCAVAIQQTLAGHRRGHGFAPHVRMGLHSASATRSGGGYRGKGVHEAARIAAAAEGGEILASVATVAQAGNRFAVSPSRSIRLKGISQPVEVVAIDWHSAAT